MSFLTETELEFLTVLGNSRKIEVRYKERLKIVLSYNDLGSKRGVSRKSGENRQKVKCWITRWESNLYVRQELEASYKGEHLKSSEYKKELLTLFEDKARSGTPPKFTQSEIEQIIALGSEKPSDLDLPFTHWSHELLKQEVVSRGIVASISTRQVGRFLKYPQTTSSHE